MPLAVTSFDSGPYLHLLFKTRATCELSELMEDGKIAEGAAKFYVACVASGLAELHAKNVAYRNVSLDALTVDERGYVVLMDFCFAENMNTVARLTDYCGLPYYLSPLVDQLQSVKQVGQVLRILRIMRVFKMARHSRGLQGRN